MERYFEWDEAKAWVNWCKHGIRFEDAASVFDDPFSMVEQDRIEGWEYRWQTLGMMRGELLVLVAHTVHAPDENTEIIRIISARKANKQERNRYETGQIQAR